MTSLEQRAAWRAASARYRARHAEKARESARIGMARYRTENPDYRERATRYREVNSDLYATHAAQRRARARQSAGEFTAEDWQSLLTEFDHRCAYCQGVNVPLEREHMRPLSRGGAHSLANIVPACATCNRRKGTLTALEFLGRAPTSPQKGTLP